MVGWVDFITLLDLPLANRKAIDTTKTIEAANVMIGMFTRSREDLRLAAIALPNLH